MSSGSATHSEGDQSRAFNPPFIYGMAALPGGWCTGLEALPCVVLARGDGLLTCHPVADISAGKSQGKGKGAKAGKHGKKAAAAAKVNKDGGPQTAE